MGSELLRRVRWSNVARACVAVVVVAAIVLWPRLGSPAPRVPDPVARPLGAAPVANPSPAPLKRPKLRRGRRRAPRPTVPARPAERGSVPGGGTNPGVEGGGVGGSVEGGG